MKQQIIFFIAIFSIFSQNFLAYGESYQLTVDENSFEIDYSTTGRVIAMEIDKELSSLLVGLENVEMDSILEIEFTHELISAENNEFAVLVNGYEVDYELSTTDLGSKLTIPIFADTEEIEIIGTNVIPEFPLGILMVLVFTIMFVVFFSRTKIMVFK
jgi:hypothetical protein